MAHTAGYYLTNKQTSARDRDRGTEGQAQRKQQGQKMNTRMLRMYYQKLKKC